MTKAFIVILLTLCFLVEAAPQQPTEEMGSLSDGIFLYEQGDNQGAIKALREAVNERKKDPKPWHYLGLAFFRQGDRKAAYVAFDKAIELRERLIQIELERKDGEWRDDQLRKLKELLSGQVEAQSKLLEIFTERRTLELGQLMLDKSQALADCVEVKTRIVDGHAELKSTDLVIEKARILSRSAPIYPESARGEKMNATISLRAILAADGSVQHIELLHSSDSRLTQESINAAKLIKFMPKTICGKPVSDSVNLELKAGQ